jgi:hypothetical protein
MSCLSILILILYCDVDNHVKYSQLNFSLIPLTLARGGLPRDVAHEEARVFILGLFGNWSNLEVAQSTQNLEDVILLLENVTVDRRPYLPGNLTAKWSTSY